MSAISDPDRLERLAGYLCDDPPNTTPQEVADALLDAAERIRSLQDRIAALHDVINDNSNAASGDDCCLATLRNVRNQI